jgi:hypothetical protein
LERWSGGAFILFRAINRIRIVIPHLTPKYDSEDEKFHGYQGIKLRASNIID